MVSYGVLWRPVVIRRTHENVSGLLSFINLSFSSFLQGLTDFLLMFYALTFDLSVHFVFKDETKRVVRDCH